MNDFFKDQDNLEVSLTPLIDTVLVLLIVFMVATPIVHNSIKLSLPYGKHNEHKDEKHDLVLAMDQYGKIYTTDKKIITLKELKNKISVIKKGNHKMITAVIFVDKDALFGIVSEFVDVLKEEGIIDVYFKTKKIAL